MPRNDMGQMMFVCVCDFDLIVLVAVFDAVGEGVRLMTGAVLLYVLVYCGMSGDKVRWLGVTLDEDFHAASAADTSNSDAGIMLRST